LLVIQHQLEGKQIRIIDIDFGGFFPKYFAAQIDLCMH